jgi:MoxR-like ATPase
LAAVPNERSDVELLNLLSEGAARLRAAISIAVVGQEAVVEAMLVTLVARGHALLVGVPGLAKTLLVSSLAQALDLSFGRVQFTPDLLPADITGTDILQEEVDPSGRLLRKLRFLPGPIFANLVLADEINRTPPKTQAALLQAMQERKVTVGTVTHGLPDPFQVFATRNPIEQEGTYALPEAQLDRFLLEIHVGYPSEADEREVARRTTSGPSPKIEPVLSIDDVRAVGDLLPRIPITDEAVALAVRLCRLSRPGERGAPREVTEFVRFGAGPRGSQALVIAAKARAALRGEAAADIDDVRALVVPALRHRLVMSYRAEAEGVSDSDVLAAVERAARLAGCPRARRDRPSTDERGPAPAVRPGVHRLRPAGHAGAPPPSRCSRRRRRRRTGSPRLDRRSRSICAWGGCTPAR